VWHYFSLHAIFEVINSYVSHGMLSPLPIPEGAWRDISMDFIEIQPKFEVYSFNKYSHFISLKHPLTAAHAATQFFNNSELINEWKCFFLFHFWPNHLIL
ncbi:hypothetical protein ACJX0J_040999, partial [Zea mays]